MVEPLGYLPELDLLVCREAAGPVGGRRAGPGDDAAAGRRPRGRRALGRLHSGAGCSIGAPHSMLVSTEILSLTRRLAKVAMDRPDYEPRRRRRSSSSRGWRWTPVDGLAVQSHGQYRPIHVFLGGGGAPP